MAKFILMRGISGSGKSTVARRLQEENNTVIVSRDDIRIALFGIPFSIPDGRQVDEDLVTNVEFEAIESALKKGHDVASDNTNLYPDGVVERLTIAAWLNCQVFLSQIDCPLAQALENNRKRGADGGRFVPEHVITKQAHAFDRYSEDIREIVNRFNID